MNECTPAAHVISVFHCTMRTDTLVYCPESRKKGGENWGANLRVGTSNPWVQCCGVRQNKTLFTDYCLAACCLWLFKRFPSTKKDCTSVELVQMTLICSS